ncbi:membrane protein insertion efficiency factor YidD [Microbacteriaceae bacterium VKM Ac-2855]|nr:membrane protein insertion efficiency factor YidD [Microbacteriaceae bacterium VKM Ac-2855]
MTVVAAPGRGTFFSVRTAARVGWFLLLLPRNLGVLLLRVYRAVISPLYGDVCRYYPSCSAYALQAVQMHGLLPGSVLAARRLLRCHPWAAGGIDDVPASTRLRWPHLGRNTQTGHRPSYAVTRFGFVVVDSPRKD